MAMRITTATRTLAITLTGFALLATGCDRKTRTITRSSPNPQVSDLKVEHDSRIVRGDFDYGINVTFIVVNLGDPGTITIQPWLTSSEGEWSREQNMYFNRGEAKQLTYFFPEPTINATNIQGGVRTQ